jgi:hypothetical protein
MDRIEHQSAAKFANAGGAPDEHMGRGSKIRD